MSDNNSGSGNSNNYDDRATAIDHAIRELARDLREERHQTGLYCLPSNHLTELRSQVTGVTIIHRYDKQEDGSISDTVVAVEPGKAGDPAWIIKDIENYRLRFTVTSRPEDASPDAINQCKDAIRQLYDTASSSTAQIQLDPERAVENYPAQNMPPQEEIPQSIDIDLEDLSDELMELQEKDMQEVILLEDKVKEPAKDISTQRAEAYLESTSLIEEEINHKGIGRKINLANIRFCQEPGKRSNYNPAKVETAMMTALIACLDDVVAEGAHYDRLIVLSPRKAYDLGSTDMLTQFKDAAKGPLTKEKRLDLISRLDASLEDRQVTPQERERLMKAVLDKGQTYAAMEKYCSHNAENLIIYELDRPETTAILRHIIPDEGNIAVMTTRPEQVKQITDAVLSKKGMAKFDDIIDPERCSIKVNGNTITFVSASSRKEFRQYVTSEEVREPHILGEHMLEVMDRAEKAKETRPPTNIPGTVKKTGRRRSTPTEADIPDYTPSGTVSDTWEDLAIEAGEAREKARKAAAEETREAPADTTVVAKEYAKAADEEQDEKDILDDKRVIDLAQYRKRAVNGDE